MGVSWNGDRAVDDGADEGPDEAGDDGGPATHDLQGEGDAVDVGTVVPDDAQSEDDEAELAEAAERREHVGKEDPDIGVVALGDGRIVDRGSHDS